MVDKWKRYLILVLVLARFFWCTYSKIPAQSICMGVWFWSPSNGAHMSRWSTINIYEPQKCNGISWFSSAFFSLSFPHHYIIFHIKFIRWAHVYIRATKKTFWFSGKNVSFINAIRIKILLWQPTIELKCVRARVYRLPVCSSDGLYTDSLISAVLPWLVLNYCLEYDCNIFL